MKSPHEMGAILGFYDGADRSRHNTKPESLQQYRVVCAAFRAFNKNTLQGFASLRLEPPGMEIRDCAVHEKNGKRWVNFPAKQYTGEDGIARWQPLVAMEGKSAYWRFQGAALLAIDSFRGSKP